MANSRCNPYLSFKTNAREAMEFYKSIFGGKLTISTFKDFGMAQDPASENLVMHSMLEADNGITFMGSDTPPHMAYRDGARISMALSGDNTAELTGYFEKLAAGNERADTVAQSVAMTSVRCGSSFAAPASRCDMGSGESRRYSSSRRRAKPMSAQV